MRKEIIRFLYEDKGGRRLSFFTKMASVFHDASMVAGIDTTTHSWKEAMAMTGNQPLSPKQSVCYGKDKSGNMKC